MTHRQAAILAFIVRYQRKHRGVSPSYVEIMRHMGGHSKSVIHFDLGRLTRAGYLRRRYFAVREIEVLKLPPGFKRPVRKSVQRHVKQVEAVL